MPRFQKLSNAMSAFVDDRGVSKFNGHETMHHLQRLQEDIHDHR